MLTEKGLPSSDNKSLEEVTEHVPVFFSFSLKKDKEKKPEKERILEQSGKQK